jgi:hypothetical protein
MGKDPNSLDVRGVTSTGALGLARFLTSGDDWLLGGARFDVPRADWRRPESAPLSVSGVLGVAGHPLARAGRETPDPT